MGFLFKLFRPSVLAYHRFRWYATLENKTPAETFPKISVNHTIYRQIGSKFTNHSPPAWRKEGQKVTLVAAIGGCNWWIRSVDNTQYWRKFWKRFRGCFVFQSRVSTKTVVIVYSIQIRLKSWPYQACDLISCFSLYLYLSDFAKT